MAELSTLARPYAKAAFELARDDNALADWSTTLAALSELMVNDELRAAVTSPRLLAKDVADLVIACGKFEGKAANFVALLAENNRLNLSSFIAARYEELRAAEEGYVDVTITAAQALTEAQSDSLSAALKQRLQREVRVSTAIDETLIGGAVVRAGDLVIDGSVRTKLQKLAASLAA